MKSAKSFNRRAQIPVLRRPNSGSAVMLIVLMMSVLAMIPLGLQVITLTSRKSVQQSHLTVQADNVARAGLVEAISWFRRQATQPVRSSIDPVAFPWPDAAFFPRQSTNTVTTDTLDESIGLVKEYPLNDANTLWGRFEVRRQPNTNANPFDSRAVHDVSDRRIDGAAAGDGLAWYLESTGIVYRRRSSNVAYNVSPNEVVGRSRAATEIRRIAIVPPVIGAVIVNSRVNVTLADNSRINGGTNTGLGHYIGGSGPTMSGGSQVLGNPVRTDIPGNGPINFQSVFGLTQNELKLMADYAVTNVNQLPPDYPTMAVVYITGNATFDASRPLRGGGILYVNGNLTINSGGVGTLYSGLVYATGNVTISGSTLISGCLITEGALSMDGNGEVAEVDYDGTILNSVRQQVAQYRENKSVFYAFSGTK